MSDPGPHVGGTQGPREGVGPWGWRGPSAVDGGVARVHSQPHRWYETACAPLLSRGSARGCTRADADGPLAFGTALIFVFLQRRNSELVYVFLSSSETVK